MQQPQRQSAHSTAVSSFLALALHIGASGVQIGFLAAVPLLTQVLQAPTVKLVERVGKRRLISVLAVLERGWRCRSMLPRRSSTIAILP
jgi:hypothetical protein